MKPSPPPPPPLLLLFVLVFAAASGAACAAVMEAGCLPGMPDDPARPPGSQSPPFRYTVREYEMRHGNASWYAGSTCCSPPYSIALAAQPRLLVSCSPTLSHGCEDILALFAFRTCSPFWSGYYEESVCAEFALDVWDSCKDDFFTNSAGPPVPACARLWARAEGTGAYETFDQFADDMFGSVVTLSDRCFNAAGAHTPSQALVFLAASVLLLFWQLLLHA